MSMTPYAAVGLSLAVALGGAARADRAAQRHRAEQAATISRERTIRDRDIEFFDARVTGDPTGSLDRLRLGALVLARGRETGNPADFVRAETEALASVRNGSRRNPGAWQLLVAARAAQHRFEAALAAADSLVQAADSTPVSRAVRGEMLVELGQYRAADQVFATLWPFRMGAGVGTRIARWGDVRGKPWIAEALLDSLRIKALADPFGPISGKAWYDYRLAELSLRYGRLGAARRYAMRGLGLDADDPRLLGVMANLAVRAGQPREAKQLAERSLLTRIDPGMLALLGEISLVTGDSTGGLRYLKAAEALAGLAGPGFHRGAALALIDHGLAVPEVLAAARRDVAGRPDTYGWDLLAWSLFRSGQRAEADRAITVALAGNPLDPSIERHARLIRAGL